MHAWGKRRKGGGPAPRRAGGEAGERTKRVQCWGGDKGHSSAAHSFLGPLMAGWGARLRPPASSSWQAGASARRRSSPAPPAGRPLARAVQLSATNHSHYPWLGEPAGPPSLGFLGLLLAVNGVEPHHALRRQAGTTATWKLDPFRLWVGAWLKGSVLPQPAGPGMSTAERQKPSKQPAGGDGGDWG